MVFPRDLEYFNFEERSILNDLVEDGIKKEELCSQLMFYTDCSADDDIVSLINGILSKIKSFSDEDFIEFIKYFPCELNISDEDIETDDTVYENDLIDVL